MRVLLPALLLLAACGARAPDYEELAQVTVATSCGGVHDAAELVRLAYEGEPFAALPSPVAVPEGALLGGSAVGSGAQLSRAYPCGDDVDGARAGLAEVGYQDLEHVSTTDRLFFFRGRDPYGIPGEYGVYACDFVGDLNQVLTGSYFDLGIFGAFPGDALPDYARAADFAALSLRTGATLVATNGFVENLVFLNMDDALVEREFRSEPRTTLATCAVWVEPNLRGGCDAVSVGDAFLVLSEDGSFHQLPFIGSPVYLFPGYCGRSE